METNMERMISFYLVVKEGRKDRRQWCFDLIPNKSVGYVGVLCGAGIIFATVL